MPEQASHFQGHVIDGRADPALVAGDFALSGGWGTTATPAPAAGSQDTKGHLDVASSGTGQGANPTVILTFKNALDNIPMVVVARSDAVAPAGGYWAVTSRTKTAVTFTFVGTPVAGNTYGLDYKVHAV